LEAPIHIPLGLGLEKLLLRDVESHILNIIKKKNNHKFHYMLGVSKALDTEF
jgi:hypothetical protein